ncbi:hypothetical protein SH467x_003395 [Pirellulaceae bacterium SH467]
MSRIRTNLAIEWESQQRWDAAKRPRSVSSTSVAAPERSSSLAQVKQERIS